MSLTEWFALTDVVFRAHPTDFTLVAYSWYVSCSQAISGLKHVELTDSVHLSLSHK